MFIFRLWNFIKGYVVISLHGYYVERFINVCIHRQILLWNIQRNLDNSLTLNISIKGFKMLPEVAEKTNCSFKILKKKGLPFILNKYKKRKAFVLGFVVFIGIFIMLTSFIWSIDIYGAKKIDRQEILDTLSEEGIMLGKIKYNINLDNAADILMTKVNGLAWVSVVIKGTRVRVDVAEAVPKPKFLPKDTFCDIVAKRDGIIRSIYATEGQDRVKEGDTVVAGQVLISGEVDIRGDETSKTRVHAMGTVKARTWHEKNADVILKTITKQKTGNLEDNISFVFFSKRFDIFNKKIKFKNYDKIEINKVLKIGNNMIFPFGILIDRYYENTFVENIIDEDEAKQIAVEQAYKEAIAEIPLDSQIISKNVNFIKKDNDVFYANVIVECIEEIGKETLSEGS